MRFKYAAAWFILLISIVSNSACAPVPGNAKTNLAPTATAFQITGQQNTPPSASVLETQANTATTSPQITFRPQLTCTACVRKPTPTITPTPNPGMVVQLEKLDVWDDPANENSYWHRQTQLITGEHVLALAKNGDWTQIIAVGQPSKKDARGYPGWVRTNGLAPSPPEPEETAIVMVRSAYVLSQPQAGAARLMRLYLDTHLSVVSQNESWVEVILPDGQEGWLRRGDVRIAGSIEEPVGVSQLIETARTLAAAPYLWGGTTPDSPDCSGFIYRLFHAYGITLARDADDQSQMGQSVPFDQKKTGDLIFYSDVSGGPVTHVGLYVGNGQLMDANPWLGLSLHALGDMQNWYVFHSVRRVLP